MRAALPLEDAVGTVAMHRKRDFLEAAAFARARAELFDLEPEPLRVAREHPVDVARPERRLVAADALAHLEDHVLVIGGIARHHREPELVLEPRRSLLELPDELLEGGVLARPREGLPRRAPLPRERVPALQVLHAAADLGR